MIFAPDAMMGGNLAKDLGKNFGPLSEREADYLVANEWAPASIFSASVP